MPSARRPAGLSAPKLGGGNVTLEGGVFEARFNMPVVHEAVRAELAARRHGTASTKTRGKVAGGGAKPWRQKGTGRARQGSIRAPHFTGGGVAFGPTPRHYTFKVNRKERRLALRSALSQHAQRETLAVFDAGAFSGPSTAQAVELLNDWDPAEPILVVLGGEEEAAGKSFRNIASVEAVPVEDLGVAELIGAASLLVSEVALPTLVARAGKSERDASAPDASDSGAPVEAESARKRGQKGADMAPNRPRSEPGPASAPPSHDKPDSGATESPAAGATESSATQAPDETDAGAREEDA